ncbi:MAG: hypothetical protein JNK21_16720 [Rhodospirillaceae bacterium]|nr:hypothetical protein [Rhodospirillaceae bacterium]
MANVIDLQEWRLTERPSEPSIGLRVPDLDDVRGIVSRTLSQAKSLGRDELTQTRAAALAVIAVRPDVTLSQAFSAISRMQAAGAV